MAFATRMSRAALDLRIKSMPGNRLVTFVDYVGKSGNNLLALFICRCGNHHVAQVWNVLSGTSTSCGCKDHGPEPGRTLGAPSTMRSCGVRNHALRSTYEGMIARCCYPSHAAYQYYGARGVKVCESWRRDFMAFVRDMGPKPTPAHSIDRIDPFGDYEPHNCRWATTAQQAANRRRHHKSPNARDK